MTSGRLTTCLWFDGNAEEAVDFYLSVFKDASRGRIGRYTEDGPGETGSVVTVEFTLNGQQFLGLNGGPQFTFSEAISFQIDCADQAEVDLYWSRLTEGGGEEGPCGWLKDRFGVSWQVVPRVLGEMLTDPDREKANRAMKKMMTMGKLDIAPLQEAYEGA
ncbi:Glyoxalase superfamily enzyme, possibly 3-demethylubiquinone-9 3-methyltransferase [Actinacidiphila yanglinensis]|uniref:Glyoxalase superfamily enzyme, possibly 3-demethylubiquinone-9 3-methyltransferase n=1 Tax=Actinacidiphila yanglinensis TaxID=310779 RepID=A0A1H5T067_9ACTN|nr:VOC family protein [Actinacidiphila yanglinensis]SEF55481.1 Glyoxalase superfamily enzyme, possibly 3-demethylubiquinone-9 3-methyltransferase [Actinacidiphila yanglinensis]